MARRSDAHRRRQRRMAEAHSAQAQAIEAIAADLTVEDGESTGRRPLRRRDVLVGAAAGLGFGGLLSGLNWFDAQSRIDDEGTAEISADSAPPAAADSEAVIDSPVAAFEAQNPSELEGHRIASLSHRLGEISAPVLLVEYFSYTCPHCATYEALIEPQLIETFVDAGKVLMVARHRPFGSDAINGSRVAIAAAQQDPAAFWPMHSLLFERIGPMAENGYDWEDFGPLGEELGLDGELLVSAAQSDAASNLLQANLAEAGNLDVNATPTFFINGERKIGAGSLDEFISELNSAVAAAT